MTTSTKPTPQQVKQTRVKAGLTQAATAKRFGYSLRAWQRKEESGETGTPLSSGEFELLQLIADSHAEYKLTKRDAND